MVPVRQKACSRFYLVVVNCSEPGFVENAIRQSQQRYQDAFSYPSSVMFQCKRGFHLLGSAVLSCQASGLWDRSLPKCLRE